MSKYQFLDFDLYIFDFDGVIVNSEKLHFDAYKNALNKLNININFDLETYQNHQLKGKGLKEYFKDVSFEKIYNQKRLYMLENYDSIELFPGFLQLYNILKENNKNVAIYTATDVDFLNLLINKYSFLKDVFIITKNNVKQNKPSIEGYLKCINHFNSKNPIIIEDSPKNIDILKMYTKYLCLYFNSNDIYYNHDYKCDNYINLLEYNFINNKSNTLQSNYLSSYINNINYMNLNFDNNILLLKTILLSKNENNNIYITSIGKNKYIAEKCISTWNSLGIKIYYIDPIECFHGSFGLLNKNDIIIILSNSGNTKELLDFSKYIKDKCISIIISQNKNNLIKEYTDYSILLCDYLNEIDYMNVCPSSSCINFMIFLDVVGFEIAKNKNYSILDFKYNHPGGELGKISSNKVDYVAIIASGQSSRLYPYTLHFPKILIEFNGDVFINHLIKYWSKLTKNIIIVIHSKYKDILNIYLEEHKNLNFVVKCFDLYTGTADTIANTLSCEYFYKNILITWSDILPKENIDINQINNSTIFTYGNNCRYNIVNEKIEKDPKCNGNVIGIYYIKNYNKYSYTIGDDFCDTLFYKKMNTYNIDELYDIGDIEKYKYHNKLKNTRTFNTIKIDNDIVVKHNIDDNLYENELNWYLNNKDILFEYIPSLKKYSNNTLYLEKIEGYSLYHSFNINDIDKIKIILDKLHSNTIEIDKDILLRDLEEEFLIKVYKRLEIIKPILNNFDNITKVNNIEINPINIDKIFNVIKNYFNDIKFYSNIHGDCQFSNIMKSSSEGKLYLIDPRGYFGKTKLYGLKEYDFAKLCYALTGYDDFNLNVYFVFDILESNINIPIKNNIELIEKYDFINQKIIKYITVIIWLSLTSYIRNNPIKVVAAYYYAHYLFTLWNLDDYKI